MSRARKGLRQKVKKKRDRSNQKLLLTGRTGSMVIGPLLHRLRGLSDEGARMYRDILKYKGNVPDIDAYDITAKDTQILTFAVKYLQFVHATFK